MDGVQLHDKNHPMTTVEASDTLHPRFLTYIGTVLQKGMLIEREQNFGKMSQLASLYSLHLHSEPHLHVAVHTYNRT